MTSIKARQVTISGSYYTNANDIESFSDVTGVLPAVADDKTHQMVVKRYAKMWLGTALDEDGRPLPRVHRVREVFIDKSDIGESSFSYVGKDIMQMTAEELQDLAAAKDLAGIPIYKTGSLALARRVAFSEYAIKVLGLDKEDMDHRAVGFNPSDYEPIKPDGVIRRAGETTIPVEESIDREALVLNKRLKSADEVSKLTKEQLLAIAKQRGLQVPGNIGYDALYKRIYGAAA